MLKTCAAACGVVQVIRMSFSGQYADTTRSAARCMSVPKLWQSICPVNSHRYVGVFLDTAARHTQGLALNAARKATPPAEARGVVARMCGCDLRHVGALVALTRVVVR